MAPRITLPGRGAIDLDVELARILNVGLLEVDADFDQDAVDGSAAPRSYIDRGDLRFYDETVTYNSNEYVLFNNRVWFANREVTGVEPGTSAADWAELTRNNIFLTFTGDMGTLNADGHQDTVTFEGGTGISTEAIEMTETLRIDLDAVIDNLTDVDTTTDAPELGQVLQWQTGRMDGDGNPLPDAWVPVSFSGSGFTSVTDGTTTLISTSARPEIDIQGADSAVSVTLSDGTTSADFEIGVVDATPTQRGLLNTADKMLIDTARAGGYQNDQLEVIPNISNKSIDLEDNSADVPLLSSASLIDIIDLADIADVRFATAPAADQVLQFDGSEWTAVSLSAIEDHGGREWDAAVSYTTGDIVSLLVSTTRQMFVATANNSGMANRPVNETTGAINSNWQEASLLRLRDIANIEITSDPNDRALLIWDSSESEWVASNSVFTGGAGIRVDNTTGTISYDGNTANGDYDFPTAADVDDVIMNPGDYFIQDRLRYRYTGISNTGFLPRRVVAGTTIPASALDSPEFERVGVQPAIHNIPVNVATVVYRGDVIIQSDTDNNRTTHMFLGISTVDGQPTAVDSLTVAASARISDDDLAAHFLTLDTDTTYTLGTSQATVDDPVTVTLTGSDTSDTNFDLVAGDTVTLTRDDTTGDVTIASTDTTYTLATSQEALTDPVTITLDGSAGTDSTFDLIAGAHTTISRDDTTGNVTITGVDTDTINIREWDANTAYVTGDQVIYNQSAPAGNLFSVYVAIQDVNAGGDTTMNPFARASNEWRTIQGGIVRLSDHAGEEGAVGFTQNATLHLVGGTGINVDLTQTSFEISQRGTGHSDVTDFGVGWRYSFFSTFGPGERRSHQGVVGSTRTIAVISEVRRNLDLNTVTLVSETDIASDAATGPSNPYAFAVTDTPDRGDRTSLAPGASQDFIGYCTIDSDRRQIHIAEVDPRIGSLLDLETWFGVSAGTPTRGGLSVAVDGFYILNDDHGSTGQHEPAVWARENTDGTDTNDQIPGTKLGNLDSAKPDFQPDGVTAIGTIDKTWIPADYVDAGIYPVDRTNVPRGGTESITVTTEGALTAQLTPQTDVANDLTDVNLTRPTDETQDSAEQAIMWDASAGDGGQWINVDLPQMASGRIEFDNTSGTTWEATRFITNVDQPTVSTRIRDTGFTGDPGGELLTFQLVDESNLMSTISFPAQTFQVYDWDQPSPEGLASMVNVVEDQFSDRFFNILTAETNANRFNIIPPSRPRDGTWTVTYVTGQRPMAPAVTSATTASDLTGGVDGLSTFRATSDDGVVTNFAETTGMQVGWRDVEILDTNRNFGTAVNFLSPYTSYTWTTEAINLNETNSAVILFNDAGTDLQGTVTYTGAGGTNTPIPDGTLSIGGAVGVVTLTHTLDIWNRSTLANDVLVKNFNRRPEVDGVARTFNIPVTRSEQPNFEYPLFWVAVDEGSNVPDATAFRDGTAILGGVRPNANARDNTQLAGIGINLGTSANIRTLYVAYPAALNAPISQNSTTTAPGNPPSTVTTSIPENDRSTASISLQGASAPSTAAENYNWFRVNIPANVTYRLNSVSA